MPDAPNVPCRELPDLINMVSPSQVDDGVDCNNRNKSVQIVACREDVFRTIPPYFSPKRNVIIHGPMAAHAYPGESIRADSNDVFLKKILCIIPYNLPEQLTEVPKDPKALIGKRVKFKHNNRELTGEVVPNGITFLRKGMVRIKLDDPDKGAKNEEIPRTRRLSVEMSDIIDILS